MKKVIFVFAVMTAVLLSCKNNSKVEPTSPTEGSTFVDTTDEYNTKPRIDTTMPLPPQEGNR